MIDKDLAENPPDTDRPALLSPDQETFLPDTGPEAPSVHLPPQGYPAVPGYEIVGTLGRGGMGVVYKARHQGLRRLVALKMILHGDHAGPGELARFRIEAESIARLQHVNIVQIYEIGDYHGLPFFSLEYVEGGTLARRIDGMPQPNQEAAHIVETLAHAMAFAHQRGIIHRDLKPANVLLTQDGVPKIVDFGLAKKLDEFSDQTHSGAILGTPSYMAPEQAGGRSKEVGPPTDIYALGAILYEMLTGRPPFRAEKPMDTILMVIQDEPVPPRRLNPKVPADLETICLKCLQKDTGKRYATAQVLADDLHRFLEGAPIAARPVTRTEWVLKWVRRRPALAAVYGLLLIVTILGTLGGMLAFLWFETDAAKRKVEKALAGEKGALQKEAEANEKLEQNSYIHRINLAWRDWYDGEVVRARKLLNYCPPSRRQWEWHYLQRLVLPELLTLTFAEEPVQVLFSPDGHNLLVLDRENHVRVWDTTTNKEGQASFQGVPVQYLVYSPDGTKIAAAGKDNTVFLWDVAKSSIRRQLTKAPQGAVLHLAFSPDGSRLATANRDRTATIWDVSTGRELFTLKGHDDAVSWVAFHPDGKHLATASWDSTVKIWDPATGMEIAGPLIKQDQALTQVVYAPDGKRLATVCVDRTVKFWDASTGMELPPLEGPMEDVLQIAFSPDSGRVAFAKKDKSIKIFDAYTGKKLFFLLGHLEDVKKVVYGPEGWRIASIGQDKTVRVWDATAGKETLPLQGPNDSVNHLVYSPDGRPRAAASMDKMVRIWDTTTGKELAVGKGHSEEVTDLAYHPGGLRLATTSRDKTVKIWDANTGAILQTLTGHTDEVTQLAYSPDGSRLVSGGLDRFVKIWDAPTGKELFSFPVSGEALHLAFGPDGRHLAVAAKNAPVHVLDPVTFKELFVLPGPTKDVFYLTFNPAGTQLATIGKDQGVILWDAVSGRNIFALKGTNEVVHLAFSPDGRWLATAGMDQNIKIWDVNLRTLAHTLEGHIGPVVSVVFSPDSLRLSSASWDRTVKLWDALTGRELLSLGGYVEEITHVTFSPDGDQLASNSRGAIKIWESKGPQSPAVWKERRYLWRAEQAAAALEAGHEFAAAFHREILRRANEKIGTK